MAEIFGQKPLVSIITPSKNSGQFIEECIQSVFDQDYPNVEHIIQDAVSKDRTQRLLLKYQKPKYQNRIKIFIEPDNGPADAFNRGLKRSQGEIILILNADDILLPHAVSWAVENMKKFTRAAVIYGDEHIIDEKGRIIKEFVPGKFNFLKLLSCETIIPAQAAFIKRSSFEKVGFYLEDSMHSGDYELWLRIAMKFPIKYMKGFVTKFRWHSKSQTLSSTLIDIFVKERREIMENLFQKPEILSKSKNLKQRAHVGLYFWAALMKINAGSKYQAIGYLLKAWMKNPSFEKFKYFISCWQQAVKDYQILQQIKKNKLSTVEYPKVSVIIPPTFKFQYLKKCLQSIISQKYPNIEILLLNNDPKKSFTKVAEKLEAINNQIKVIPNRRQNKFFINDNLIAKIRGDIILLINTNAMLAPHTLPYAIETLQRNPQTDIIYADHYLVNKHKSPRKLQIQPDFNVEQLLCYQFIPSPKLIFLKRDVLKKVKLRFIENGENLDFNYSTWLKIAQKCSVVHLKEVFTWQHRHQLSGRIQQSLSLSPDTRRKLIKRLYQSKNIPFSVKFPKRKIYSLMDLQSSELAFRKRNPQEGIYFLIKSFLTYPSLRTFIRILQTARMFMSFIYAKIPKLANSRLLRKI